MFVTGTGACLMDYVQYNSVDRPLQHRGPDLPLPRAGLKPLFPTSNRRHRPLYRHLHNNYNHLRLNPLYPTPSTSRNHPQSSAVAFDITNVSGTSGYFWGRRPPTVVQLRGITLPTPSLRPGAWSTLPTPSHSKDAGLWNL